MQGGEAAPDELIDLNIARESDIIIQSEQCQDVSLEDMRCWIDCCRSQKKAARLFLQCWLPG